MKKTSENSNKSNVPNSSNKGLWHYIKRFFVYTILLLIFSIFIAPPLFNDKMIVTRYDLSTDKNITGPIKIVLITDLHSSYFGSKQNELVQAIKSETPDMIFLVGDIADDIEPIQGTVDLLEGIKGSCPIYYVSGNHEYWSKRIDRIKDLFLSYGVHVLEGHSVQYKKKYDDGHEDTIYISGIDDPYEPKEKPIFQVKRAYSEIDDLDDYMILLTHRPELKELYDQFSYDLILSGHAHGGQWRIPIIEMGLYAPNQGFFPKYTKGIYKLKNSPMIVSTGLCTIQKVPRVFNRPELVVISVTPSK